MIAIKGACSLAATRTDIVSSHPMAITAPARGEYKDRAHGTTVCQFSKPYN
jgi:hypothetical protein